MKPLIIIAGIALLAGIAFIASQVSKCDSCERNSSTRTLQLICNDRVVASTRLCDRFDCRVERGITLEQRSFDLPCPVEFEIKEL